MIASVALGLVVYLAACAYLYFTGRALVGVRLEIGREPTSALLAPAASLTVHVVAVAVAITAGFTTRQIALGISPLAALLGARGAWIAARDAERVWIREVLCVCGVGAVPFVGPFASGLVGFPGSSAWDGWAYVAGAQYLHDLPFGTDGGLPPVHEYGAWLAGSARFMSSALIGLISAPLLALGIAHDVQEGTASYLAVLGFVAASTCAWSWRAVGPSRSGAFVYAFVCVASAWTLRALRANNFDQLLFLSFLPALAATRNLGRAPARLALILGTVLAAALICYPELCGAALLTAGAGALLAWRDAAGERGQLLRRVGLGLGTTIVLFLPMARFTVRFLAAQFAYSLRTTERAGEGAFPDLADWHQVPLHLTGLEVPWLLPVSSSRVLVATLLAIAIALCLFLARGTLAVARASSTRHLPLVALVLVTMYALFLCHYRYPYAAFKFGAAASWLLAWFLCEGIRTAPRLSIGRGRQVALAPAASAMLVSACTGMVLVHCASLPRLGPTSWARYRAAREALAPSPSRTVFSAVNEPLASMWTTYYLRERPFVLMAATGYLANPSVQPYLRRASRAAQMPSPGDIVLLDAAQAKCSGRALVWSNEAIAAVELGREQPLVFGAIAEGPRELNDGDGLTWMNGDREMELRLVAPTDGAAVLVTRVVQPSPGRLSLEVRGARESRYLPLTDEGRLELPVSFRAGMNAVRLHAHRADEASQLPQSSTWRVALGCVSARPLALAAADANVLAAGSLPMSP